MSRILYNTFRSPYHYLTLETRRYRKVVPYLLVLMVILPLLFLPFKSFFVHLLSQVGIIILFPLFLWVYLNTDKETDVKLDVLKIFVIMTLYFSYFMLLTLVMARMLQPVLKNEFVFLNLGYVGLLFIIGLMVSAAFFHHRYTQRILSSLHTKHPSL